MHVVQILCSVLFRWHTLYKLFILLSFNVTRTNMKLSYIKSAWIFLWKYILFNQCFRNRIPQNLLFLSEQTVNATTSATGLEWSPDQVQTPGMEGHNLVHNDNFKQKICQYCKITGNKTRSGWTILTGTKCSSCNVPLCRGTTYPFRECFKLYHDEVAFAPKSTVKNALRKMVMNPPWAKG
jgi:hypothetical protein